VDSERTPQASSRDNTCAFSQLQSSGEKQTSETTALLPAPKDEKPKPVVEKDELFAELSSMGELRKTVNKLKETFSVQSDL
jgi:hypothetical protein